jgi:predicted hydrocarbon binding protein
MVGEPIKDRVIEWYFSHFIFPKSQIIDRPGFIVFNISGKSPVFIRQVLVPERFFVELERRLVQEFGEEGKQVLYSAGKKFGHRFSSVGRFPRRGEVSDNNLRDYFAVVDKFIEGMYATSFEHYLDLSVPKVNVRLKKFIVIDKLGYGYFLPLGGGAGIISWLLNDDSIEGALVGKEGDDYALVYAPADKLGANAGGAPTLKETSLSGYALETYYPEFNKIADVKHPMSLKNLIDSRFFNYAHGVLSHDGERFFIIEASALYVLEKELAKKTWGKKILAEVGRQGGEAYAFSDVNYAASDIEKFLTAFGLGDPFIKIEEGKVSAMIVRFPWTKDADEVEFILVRSLLEGFLSKALNKKIEFFTARKDYSCGFLALSFE